MPLFYALAPMLLTLGLALLVLSLLAWRLSRTTMPRRVAGRVGRAGAVLALLGALPFAAVIVQGGGLPGSFGDAMAEHTFGAMGSTILR